MKPDIVVIGVLRSCDTLARKVRRISSRFASDAAMLLRHFSDFEGQCKAMLELGLPLPAYDYCLKCSHTFNLLDARGAISITERTGYIGRVRALAAGVARAYAAQREELGYPMLNKDAR